MLSRGRAPESARGAVPAAPAASPAPLPGRPVSLVGRRRRRRGRSRPTGLNGPTDDVGKTRCARERHAFLEDPKERRPHPPHPLQTVERPERPEALPVGHDPSRQRRPNPRQRFEFGRRRPVDVDREDGSREWGIGSRAERRTDDAASRHAAAPRRARDRLPTPHSRLPFRARPTPPPPPRVPRRIHRLELARERRPLLGPGWLPPHRASRPHPDAEARDAGEKEERAALTGGR